MNSYNEKISSFIDGCTFLICLYCQFFIITFYSLLSDKGLFPAKLKKTAYLLHFNSDKLLKLHVTTLTVVLMPGASKISFQASETKKVTCPIDQEKILK